MKLAKNRALFSDDIFSTSLVIKLRIIRYWDTGGVRNTHKMFVHKPKITFYLGDLGTDVRIILKWAFRK
jgi:hypothetical protein